MSAPRGGRGGIELGDGGGARRGAARGAALSGERGAGHAYGATLELEPNAESSLNDVLGHSITYRIAVGQRTGHKALTLRTLPARDRDGGTNGAAEAFGFSLHAGIGTGEAEREKLEHLCRYVSRPAVATGRLALTAQGQVRYTLKTPYGTAPRTSFEPLDFMARLAALVPPPRAHLMRYHGVFAPHSRWRQEIVPGRGVGR